LREAATGSDPVWRRSAQRTDLVPNNPARSNATHPDGAPDRGEIAIGARVVRAKGSDNEKRLFGQARGLRQPVFEMGPCNSRASLVPPPTRLT
jgi:hypothetical protein